jgi:hypothetical protein
VGKSHYIYGSNLKLMVSEYETRLFV